MFKKINKGIALAAIAVLAVVGFYTWQFVGSLDDRQELRSLVNEFYSTVDDCLVTPSDKLSFDSTLSYNDTALKEAGFADNLKNYFTDDARYSKSLWSSQVAGILERQLDNELRIHERNTGRVRLSGIKFKKDMAYASINVTIYEKLEKVDLTNSSLNDAGEPVYNTVPYEGTHDFYGEIVFKLIDGHWQIASLDGSSAEFVGYDFASYIYED